MFENMTLSKKTIPHFSIFETLEMTRLMKIREEINKNLEKENLRLTYLPLIMKACAQTLKEFPILNSRIDEKNILYQTDCNLGFAVDTPEGLLVPSIKKSSNSDIKESGPQS